jgi:hypothetical protein
MGDERALLAETTAFLTGHMTTTGAGAGAAAPGWAQVNTLAHARPAVLLRHFEWQRRRTPSNWVGGHGPGATSSER